MYYRTANHNLRFLASLHVVPAASPDLPAWAFDAYEWSESLVFEAELGPATLSFFIAQDGVPLSQKLSPSVYAGLKKLWHKQANLPDLDTLRPWAAAVLSATVLSPMVGGIEHNFIHWAKEDGKELNYLEPPCAFPALADAIPVELVDSTLANTLADLDAASANQLAMHQAWVSGSMTAFAQIAHKSPLLGVPQIKSALLDLRNQAWAAKLKLLQGCTNRTLVAVGALHLCMHPTAQHFAAVDLQIIE